MGNLTIANQEYDKYLKDGNNFDKLIALDHEKDDQMYKKWQKQKESLSKREKYIVTERQNIVYHEKLIEEAKTESRVAALAEKGLWNLATDQERAAAGRQKGLKSDSEQTFEEYQSEKTKKQQISAFAIHDLDLEQETEAPVRRFHGDDGNVEVDQSFSFDSQSDNFRWLRNRPLAFAHYALRSLDKEKLKTLQGDVK